MVKIAVKSGAARCATPRFGVKPHVAALPLRAKA